MKRHPNLTAAVLDAMARGQEYSAEDIAKSLRDKLNNWAGASQVSYHLRKLLESGAVVRRQDGPHQKSVHRWSRIQ